MKKVLCIVLGIALAAMIAVGCFCCFGNRDAEETPTPPREDPAIYGKWTFTMEKDFFYYPTLKGSVCLEDYPARLVLAFNGEEREIDLSNVDYNFVFIFRLDQEFLYNEIKKGTYDVMIFAYYGGRKTLLGDPQKIEIKHDFFLSGTAIDKGGPHSEGMDSNDFWTGNY